MGRTFHGTDFDFSDSKSSPYHLILSNIPNPNLREAHIGSFHLDSGIEVVDGPLVEGKYSTGNMDDRIISAEVTINSISSTEDDFITEIEIDYTFKRKSVIIVTIIVILYFERIIKI